MYNYPSRSERRQEELYAAAERGCKFIDNVILYFSEIKKLEKSGFTLMNIKIFDAHKKLYSATIFWGNAYKCGTPYVVFSYITGVINTYPKIYINNFAEELFVISERASLRKK